MHSEYLNDRSPNPALNNLNQVQYGGANLWDLEHAPAASRPPEHGGLPALPGQPLLPAGGFGEIDKYTGNRWTGEVKSTHIIEAGGHNELKYGWHIELGTFDLTRDYSGTPGDARLLADLPARQPERLPAQLLQHHDFLHAPARRDPGHTSGLDLVGAELQGQLNAYVKSLSNAFFLQDSYSPDKLRNLTINAGVRSSSKRCTTRTATPS